MRRRSRAGGEQAKSQRRKTTKPERRNAPKAVRSRKSTGPETAVAQLTRELNEARQQQVATADVLKVISRSSTDVQPVFDMIAESARRLCDGQFCFVYRFDGQLLHFVAHHSLTPEVLEMNRRAYPAPPSRKSAAARAILERGFVQIPDINADPDYVLGPMAVVGDYRSVVAVPILRDCLAVGSIAVARAQAGLLPDPQIELFKDLRRPSGDRYRECAIVRCRAAAHTRAWRIAGATDRDSGCAARHQLLAWRSEASISSHAGERRPHLRGNFRQLAIVRRRCVPAGCNP